MADVFRDHADVCDGVTCEPEDMELPFNDADYNDYDPYAEFPEDEYDSYTVTIDAPRGGRRLVVKLVLEEAY